MKVDSITNQRFTQAKSYTLKEFRKSHPELAINGQCFDTPQAAKQNGCFPKSYWRTQRRELRPDAKPVIVPTGSIELSYGLSFVDDVFVASVGDVFFVPKKYDCYYSVEQTVGRNETQSENLQVQNDSNYYSNLTSLPPTTPPYEVPPSQKIDVSPYLIPCVRQNAAEAQSTEPHLWKDRIYFPETLNIDAFSDAEKWILHTVYIRHVMERVPSKDFIPLKNDYLRAIIGRCERSDKAKQRLLNSGILETDGYYIKGQKSLGYRVRADLQKATWRLIEIADSEIIHNRRKRKPVWNWLEQNLRRVKVEVPTKDVLVAIANANKHEDQSIDDMVRSYDQSMNAINDGVFYFDFNNAPGRLYTNLTSLKRELRSFVRVDGRPLAELDMKTSQAVLLAHYMRHTKTIRRLDTVFESALEADLYAELANAAGTTRSKAKEEFVEHILFGANGYKSNVKTALTVRFPKTAEFLRQQKEQDEGASKLATALQKLEAQAVIHKTADRIRKQRPEVFLATIHDSILIFPDDLCYAQHVFQDELRKLKINAKLKGQSL